MSVRGIPAWEMLARGGTLAAFIAADVSLLARVFRASLLPGAGKRRPGRIATPMRRAGA